MVPAETTTVGKKQARKPSESRRFEVLVRMDRDVCELGKKIAALRGVSMAELFDGVLRPWVQKEWAREKKKIREEPE